MSKAPQKLFLGAMPVRMLESTLGLELDDGDVVLTANAQKHASRRHPHDYPRLLPHIAAIVADPMYVGDDFKNPGKIELVSRVPSAGGAALVAVEVTPNANGEYAISSFYPISETKIQNRRAKGTLYITK